MLTAQELDKRREIIVSELEAETASTVKLALIYGITRERVSQIYYKAIGYKRRGLLLRKQLLKAKEKRFVYNMTIKFFCDKCNKMVNRLNGKSLQKYCRNCSDKGPNQRTTAVSYSCTSCRKLYYPFRQAVKSQKLGHFCRRECYFAFLKGRKHVKKVGKKRN